MNTKQVIVMRKFSNLRTGKYIAQACHASMVFLTKNGKINYDVERGKIGSDFVELTYYFKNSSPTMEQYYEEINHWLKHSFRKIVCYVSTEEELKEVHQRALDAGLISHLIEDNGTTEFGGVKTKTCCAIGPHYDEKFEGITSNLPLL